MVERRSLSSGRMLAGRYELEDLIDERMGASTWRAADTTLTRSVGIQIVTSADPRATAFAAAARASTIVTDPRFLRILDVVEDEAGLCYVIREWARGFSLDQLLVQSPLPNRRAATVISEVAEAFAHAHEHRIYHRFLTPHSILVKESGAVRISGLCSAAALHEAKDDGTDHDFEQGDVEAIGKLLYASLSSRWPGSRTDGLGAAPTLHGRLLRPRQVRAGVSRDVDTVCDRILGDPPRNDQTPLRTAHDVARVLRLAGEDESQFADTSASLLGSSSPDLLRLDPVVLPEGPPPGINPPRRRPKAFEPAPPTTFERGKERAKTYARGDRALIALGVVIALALASVLAFLVGRSSGSSESSGQSLSKLSMLPIESVQDFDPLGDKQERPGTAKFSVDDNQSTTWRTSNYFNNPRLGGVKAGVGLLVDLGGAREVTSVRVSLLGGPTDLAVYATRPETTSAPSGVGGLVRIGAAEGATRAVTLAAEGGVVSRYLVVWLTRLPEVAANTYRGEIAEVAVFGRS
ncbi:hypothetical protein BH09ACT10_BH09ACT10_13030 [soil metagenome]